MMSCSHFSDTSPHPDGYLEIDPAALQRQAPRRIIQRVEG